MSSSASRRVWLEAWEGKKAPTAIEDCEDRAGNSHPRILARNRPVHGSVHDHPPLRRSSCWLSLRPIVSLSAADAAAARVGAGECRMEVDAAAWTHRAERSAARRLATGSLSRAQPTPVASRVAARPTAASTLPLIASARTSPAACNDARIRHRWSIPPKGFVGFAIRTVTLCTRPPNRLRARCTRRTAIVRTATDCRGSAPVTSILNAQPVASIQKLLVVPCSVEPRGGNVQYVFAA